MNVKLLRKIQKHILEEPLRYDQFSSIDTDPVSIRQTNGDVPACGTMACIAGWAYLLGAKNKNKDVDIFSTAQKLLRISKSERMRLFCAPYYFGGVGWPLMFERAYKKAETPAERAQVAFDRIDLFIKTKGAE